MVFFKHVIILFSILGLISCGSSEEKKDTSKQKSFVTGVPNLQYLAEFSCRKTISTEKNSELYSSLGLSAPIIIYYQVFTGSNSIRTVAAKVENSSFLKSASDYYQDTATSAQVVLIADVSGASNNGFWTFGISSGTAQFIYSDAGDLGSTISGSFSDAECLGTIQ